MAVQFLDPYAFNSIIPFTGLQDSYLLVTIFAVLAFRFQDLSNNELIRRCAYPAENWNRMWAEFEARFGGIIVLLLYRGMTKPGVDGHTNEFPETLQDLKQDVYIKLLKNNAEALRKFNGRNEKSIFAYLNIISKNIVLNYVKKQECARRSPRPVFSHGSSDSNEYGPIGTNSTAEELEWQFLKEAIIASLRERWKGANLERDLRIFELYFFEGLYAGEILKKCPSNLSKSGIDTLIYRMRKCLRDLKTIENFWEF